MPIIVYIEPDGTTHNIEVPVGCSVMEGAKGAAVRGIDADCGGNCACGTCHVYVDAKWSEQLPRGEDMEAAILESTSDVQPTSRLSCQIKVTEQLDGLTVRVPLVVR
jgi:2Fe-2S ferredoxin